MLGKATAIGIFIFNVLINLYQLHSKRFSSVELLSRVWLFVTPWIEHARPPCPSPTPRVHPNPCPSSRWCHPTISSSVVPFSSCPQSFSASGSFPMSRVFSNESALRIRWAEYWNFSFNISLSNEHPGLISFRMDWLDLLAVQGTQESSSAPQFKTINSLALSFLHSPTLTSIHNHWKNHSLD